MAWSPTNPPKRGGSYSRFIVKRRQTIPKSSRGRMFVPIVHDWGPFKQFVDLESFAEFIEIFGQGGSLGPPVVYTPGFLAVYNAFKGESADRPGAAQVLVYRMGAAAAAKATRTLQNTTPAVAITLTARYEGARGNNLRVRVEANAADPSNKNDLVISEGGLEYERFPHTKTDIAALAANINARSGWFTAVSNITGVALAVVADQTPTGGNDGSTLVAGDWTALMTASEPQKFDVMVPYDLIDSSITTSLASWAKTSNTPIMPGRRSKRFMLGIGGASGETLATALTRSSGIDDENVFNVGVGSYKDTALDITLSPSQLVPRIGGILARRGFDAAISFAHLADLEIVTGPTDAEILSAIDTAPGVGGVVVLSLDSAGVRIEKDVTTRVSDTDDRPKETFGRIKYVMVMQAFERGLQERHEAGLLSLGLEVNDDTREYVVSDARIFLDEFLAVGAVQAGAMVGIAADPPPSDDDEFVALDWLAKFGRTLDQIRSTFYMS